MAKWLIYCHTNLINDKKYIGLTKYITDPNHRWRNGLGYLNSHHKIFAAAIEEFGGVEAWNINWSHEILETNIETIEQANKRERYWIAFYHTFIGDAHCMGYNATPGGDGTAGRIMSDKEKEYRRQLKLGTKASEATKQKMSRTRKGKPQHMTEKKIQQINNMHEIWKGQHHTEESLSKIREASLGRTHSEQTKQKIRQAKLANTNKTLRPGSGIKKPVRCIDTNEEFASITEASLKYNISKSSIMSCAKGNRRTAGGYRWEYIL